jgi:uncharacterized membrane protein
MKTLKLYITTSLIVCFLSALLLATFSFPPLINLTLLGIAFVSIAGPFYAIMQRMNK